MHGTGARILTVVGRRPTTTSAYAKPRTGSGSRGGLCPAAAGDEPHGMAGTSPVRAGPAVSAVQWPSARTGEVRCVNGLRCRGSGGPLPRVVSRKVRQREEQTRHPLIAGLNQDDVTGEPRRPAPAAAAQPVLLRSPPPERPELTSPGAGARNLGVRIWQNGGRSGTWQSNRGRSPADRPGPAVAGKRRRCHLPHLGCNTGAPAGRTQRGWPGAAGWSTTRAATYGGEQRQPE